MEKNREKGIVRVSIVGIAGNILLVAIKATIGFLANSISIISDAINNLTDALSSLITIVGTKLSNKRPNKKHPYGYGRVEYITSVVIGLLIFVAGFTAIYESINSIIDYFQNGTMSDYSDISFIIISVAIVIKFTIAIFYRIKSKKYESDVLKASSTDALFDVLLSISTLVGAIVSRFTGFFIEGYLGILIGLFIIKSGVEVIASSVSSVIGSRTDEQLTAQIKKEIQSIDKVKGVYDLILNNYGPNNYIGSVHVGVDSDLTANEIQSLERTISGLMYLKHNIIITVGIYTENPDSELAGKIKKEVMSIIQRNKNILQLHGFYLSEERKICNFDLVYSFDEKDPNVSIKEITAELKEKFTDIFFIINLDRDY
mgnify:CR=1 FL=1